MYTERQSIGRRVCVCLECLCRESLLRLLQSNSCSLDHTIIIIINIHDHV